MFDTKLTVSSRLVSDEEFRAQRDKQMRDTIYTNRWTSEGSAAAIVNKIRRDFEPLHRELEQRRYALLMSPKPARFLLPL